MDEVSAVLPRRAASPAWRTLDRLALAAAVVALLIPGALFLAGRRPALIDNRPLLKPPAADVSRVFDTTFYAAVDAYLADNVALRAKAVRLRSTLDAGILGGNVDPAVIRGIDGWLFARSELVPACGLTADQVGAGFERLATAFQASGKAFRVVIVPDKHAIYPDRLDTGNGLPTPCTDEQRDAMRAWIAGHPELAVDGWAPLLEARTAGAGRSDLYYAQDTHWTPTGAVAVIERLVTALGPSIWDPRDVVHSGKLSRRVDLAMQQGIPRTEVVPRLRIRPDVKVERTTIPVSVPLSNARAIYRYVPAQSQHHVIPGRTAIVYDSFFGTMQPLVAPFFEDSVWIHEGDLEAQPALASELGPFDRVIYERVERGLYLSDVDRALEPLVATGG
jgi:hypothetical protein